jgi:hypothetical protein
MMAHELHYIRVKALEVCVNVMERSIGHILHIVANHAFNIINNRVRDKFFVAVHDTFHGHVKDFLLDKRSHVDCAHRFTQPAAQRKKFIATSVIVTRGNEISEPDRVHVTDHGEYNVAGVGMRGPDSFGNGSWFFATCHEWSHGSDGCPVYGRDILAALLATIITIKRPHGRIDDPGDVARHHGLASTSFLAKTVKPVPAAVADAFEEHHSKVQINAVLNKEDRVPAMSRILNTTILKRCTRHVLVSPDTLEEKTLKTHP